MDFSLTKLAGICCLFSLLWVGCHSAPRVETAAKSLRGNGWVLLDEKKIRISWDDGDTFSWREDGRKKRARLKGYNTLESYGPVHSWANWRPTELFEIAYLATAHARSQVWRCKRLAEGGGYGRLLVDCPQLRKSLLEKGLAHVFWLDGAAPPTVMAPQTNAIAAGVGMWKRGSPNEILTSIHSASEENLAKPYNRMVSTQTGEARISPHVKRYKTCQKVCAAGSCMTYVPYTRRYGKKRASCLTSRP